MVVVVMVVVVMVLLLLLLLLLLHATPHGVLPQRRGTVQRGRHRIITVRATTGSHCYSTAATIATIGTEAKR
jgi:hypothetical protein